jgi:hypothetical protein
MVPKKTKVLKSDSFQGLRLFNESLTFAQLN